MKTKNILQDYIIFTDLDGTLLDHHDYSFAKANEMLSVLKKSEIPLILITSKTKAEVIEIRKQLDIQYPFIVENGAGIFIPKADEYESIALGKTYPQTLNTFKKYKKTIEMTGFHEMSIEQITSLTGLSIEKASLAHQRNFSEPFILKNPLDLKTLQTLVAADGFDVVQGGRFYHLITKGQDKANALQAVHLSYEKKYKKKYKTLALGDGENDITMLQAADQAILIKRVDHSYVPCFIPNSIKSDFIGPTGWNQTLKRFFDVH